MARKQGQRFSGNWARLAGLVAVAALWFLSPATVSAQNTGRIECARNDEYVYLYGSLATLQVRGTVQCGEIVYITLRYEDYYGVRTAKGETGYVPRASVSVLKDKQETAVPPPPAELPREQTHYDKAPREAPVHVAVGFTLVKNTPVRIKLMKTISSANANVGEAVELEVVEDVLVQGVPVLTRGSKASAVVAEVEPKRKFGHPGKVAISITALRLANGEPAPLRDYEETSGASSTTHVGAEKMRRWCRIRSSRF
ncbi:MAG: hypothetical protein ABLT11_06770 [Candidatus Acidiferrum sp.]